MGSSYQIIALITAGVSLSMGLIFLAMGLHKEADKTDLVFGIMCISMFIFFMMPPAGFILVDQAPYSGAVIAKRIFNALYQVLLPWFIFLYAGYHKKILPLLSNALSVAVFFIMAYTPKDSSQPLWVTAALIPIGITLLFGSQAVTYLLRAGKKTKGYWFLGAMIVFAFFYILTAVNQFAGNIFGNFFHAKVFFPINLFPLAFILIMGVRLSTDSFEKFTLEKLLRLRDLRWHSLLEQMQLIVLELDTEGRIKYINPFGVKILGYTSSKELLEKEWFSNYLPPHEAGVSKSIFTQSLKAFDELPHFKNDIKTRTNKWVRVSWTNIFVQNEQGAVKSVLSIGSDISKEETAFREIAGLKAELEKENLILKGRNPEGLSKGEIIGQSEVINYAIQRAGQVAESTAIVLLEGETGVGKELFANLIHDISLRSKFPLVKINCGALPAELIEDELFGHEKGAFTNAIQARKGRFEQANGGTIFLDEIGELPLPLQPKLLRVLQSGEFERIGGQHTIKVNVRVISATNKNLQNEVRQGRFREDLYYRLAVFPITIPPLRSRREDISLLISYFLEKENEKHHKKIKDISKADVNRLCGYSWPGNIRELKNVIERSVISSNSDTLKLDWFDHSFNNEGSDSPQMEYPLALEHIEKEHILKLLAETNWQISGENGAAHKLDMHPNTLRSRMKRLHITRADQNSSSGI